MAKILEKVVRCLVNILTTFVFLCLVILLYGKLEMSLTHRAYPNYFGYTLFKVTTGSMGEVVKIDDVILVKITKDVKEQDVITYRENDSFITHRVVKMGEKLLTTKGDSNNTEDHPILKDAVVGKVVFVLSGLGIWQHVFSTPKILISIFVTLLLFDAAFSYKDKQVEKKLEKTRKLELKKKGIDTMTDTQILEMDEILKQEQEKRKKAKQKKTVEKEEKLTKNQIEEALGKTQVILIQPLLDKEEKKKSSKGAKPKVTREKENAIDLIPTQRIPIQTIQKAYEEKETKAKPIRKRVDRLEKIYEEESSSIAKKVPTEVSSKRKTTNKEIEILETQNIPIETIRKMSKEKTTKKGKKEEEIEILMTQNIPVEQIQDVYQKKKKNSKNTEIEILETREIPVEEIKRESKSKK